MIYKKENSFIYCGLIVILIVKWYMAYRFLSVDTPYEELIDVISMSSNFTNITYMLSIYSLFYLFITAIHLPFFDEFYGMRYTRKEYIKLGTKIVLKNAFFFSLLIAGLQVVLLFVQFKEASQLLSIEYFLGFILNVILWGFSYSIIGMLSYFIFLISKSKFISVGTAFCVSLMMLVAFRFYQCTVLFTEMDIYIELWNGGINMLTFFCVNLKYIAILWLINIACEAVFQKRDVIVTKSRRDQYE